METGLRLITDRLAVPAALLFAAGPGGALRLVSAVGTWDGDPLALRGLAETLDDGADMLDVTGAIEGARFAAGARLGDGEGALLVIAPDDRTPDDDWTEAFVTSTRLALALVRSAAQNALTRVLHEVAVHPGTFDERLALALMRLADALGLDAAVFARAEGADWTPEAIFDPSGHLIPTRPIPLKETFCAFTVQSDGPFAIQDAASSPLPIRSPAAYLGAPVFVGGRCAGTLSAAGHAPRARPFGDEDRALVEALARWIGSAVGGRETARQLAEREATLSAFFDAAPMGLGILRVAATGAPPHVQLVTANAATAALLATEIDVLSDLSTIAPMPDGPARQWIGSVRDALGDEPRQQVETEIDGRDGRRTLATTLARIDDPADLRYTFVVQDTTDERRAADRLREREAQIEALVSQAPVALFAADRAGRLATARGRNLDRLGLAADRALGQPVADLLAGPPAAAAGIRAALAGHDGAWTMEADGRTFRIQVLARRDPSGRPAGFIGVALDTTGLQTADAGPERSPEATAFTRSALLKHFDHEFRSPLTSILGYADLLSENTSPEEVVEVRDVIGRSGERLLSALDDLLDLTLLDDHITVYPAPLDVGALVTQIAEAGRAAADARRLTLNLWCMLPDEPVLIDARLFERVARHLVSGALAAAVARVDIRLRAMGTGEMELSVLGGIPTDRLGIGPELIHRLTRALGGTAEEVAGEAGGWVVRLPRQRVPMVNLAEPVSEIIPVDTIRTRAPHEDPAHEDAPHEDTPHEDPANPDSAHDLDTTVLSDPDAPEADAWAEHDSRGSGDGQ